MLKKTLLASEQEREDIVQARAEWAEFQNTVDSNRLIFLDESGVKTNMTRLYGRALHGERCHDSAPNGHWEAVTVLSSIRLDGATECIVFEGAVDRKMFDEYVKTILASSLRPGDIVIMDNLSAHKSQDVYDVIKEKQAECLFLPAYSPDLNPIEKMWSKVKQILRGIKARTHEDLFTGVRKALDSVSAKDAQSFFAQPSTVVLAGSASGKCLGEVPQFAVRRGRRVFAQGGWTLPSYPIQKRRATQTKRKNSTFP